MYHEEKNSIAPAARTSATHAHGQARARRAKPSRLDQDTALRTFVEQRLMDGWSPEAIAGWLKAGNEALNYINHESIYRYIYSKAGQAMKLYCYLFQRKKRRRALKARTSKDRIPNRTSIHDRPQEIEDKLTIGDWEADYMIFKNRQPLLVLHERKSRLVLAVKLFGRSAAETIAAMIAKFKTLGKARAKSVTFDNNTGFALHHLLTQRLDIKTFFCDAYASWQKGGVENSNGRIRRWLPKRTNLAKVTEQEIDDIIMTMNLTPRRCLGFKTPLQVMMQSANKHLKLKFA